MVKPRNVGGLTSTPLLLAHKRWALVPVAIRSTITYVYVLFSMYCHYHLPLLVHIAPAFLRKIKDAVPERAQHVDDFEELTENLPPESVAAWTVAVEAWEADRRQVNPFVSIAESKVFCFVLQAST